MDKFQNRFDDTEELSEEETEYTEDVSGSEEYEASEIVDDLPEETSNEDDDDIAVMAEMITASRKYIPEVDGPKFVGTTTIDTISDGTAPENTGKEPGGLFCNFTLKKAIVTAVSALLTVAVLVLTAFAAVSVSNDKVIRDADFDFIVDEADVIEAMNRKDENPTTHVPGSYDTVEDPDDSNVPESPSDNVQFKVVLDFYDRDDIELYSTRMTIGELLKVSGIELLEGEELSVSEDSIIAAEATIKVDKYEYTSETLTESLPYESERRETDLIPRGQTNYIQYGSEGVAEKTYTLKLKNGEEVARELSYTQTSVYPTNEIYEIGVGGTVYGADGSAHSYSYRKVVKATYYYLANDPYTYLGNHPDNHTIAVDPNVIKLGTWVYVKNSKYDFGLRQAQDIGSAIKGDMIDIWLDGSEPGYQSFANTGIHYDMEIYFVD